MAPLGARHIEKKIKKARALAQSCMIQLFRCFWVGEFDSDFIFTIWHHCHPHSGFNFHISGNGIIIQSYTFVRIFSVFVN